jgi:hypothetical protein
LYINKLSLVTIDPVSYSLTCFVFFIVFSDALLNFKGLCTCSALFNFQDTVSFQRFLRCNFYIIPCFRKFVK